MAGNQQGLNPYAPPFPAVTKGKADDQMIGYHPSLMSTGFSPMVPSMSRSRVYIPEGFERIYPQMQSTTESAHCDFIDPLGGYNQTANVVEPNCNYTSSVSTP